MIVVIQMAERRGYEYDDQVDPNCPVLVPTGEYIACQFISVLSWPIKSKNFDILSFIFGSTDSIGASEELRSLYLFVSMKTLGGISNLALGLNILEEEESKEGEEGMLKVGSLAGSREGLFAIQPLGREFWTMLITQSMAALMSFCNFFISLLILSLNLMYSNFMSCRNSIESWLTFMGLFLGEKPSQSEFSLGIFLSEGWRFWTYGLWSVLMAVGLLVTLPYLPPDLPLPMTIQSWEWLRMLDLPIILWLGSMFLAGENLLGNSLLSLTILDSWCPLLTIEFFHPLLLPES